MEKELLTVEETASYLHLNEQTVRAMARQGRLPAFKVGRSWRFCRDDLDPAKISQEKVAKETRILIIDDDPLVHALLESSLAVFQPIVATALNGEEGLKILVEQEIEMIFLDLSMPGMGGPETLRHIRELKGNIMVVIVTSYPESSLMEEAMQYGPFILLAKPFTPQQVMACFANLTRSAQPENGVRSV